MTPYYLTNDQVKASVKHLQTTAKVHQMHNRDTAHIRPLWVAQSQGSQVSQTDYEVNTEAGCNILPTHKAQKLFGHEWLRTLDLPRVHVEAYSGQSVHSLGSCVLHLHVDNKAFQTVFEVTNTTGPIILGRAQAKSVGYVEFPKIKCPHTFITYPTTSKKICTIKTSAPETFHPQTQWVPHPEYIYTKMSQPRPHKQSSLDRLQNQWCHK